MNHEDHRNWQHDHNFTTFNEKSERNTLRVIALTLVAAAVEITAGIAFASMALTADGIHMMSHALALTITAIACAVSRTHARDRRYSFGTGKVGILGGFTSAILLFVAALVMAGESAQRILNPETIHFNEAMIIAAAGLVINIVSALMLDGHDKEDHNIRAAYLHVLADALTSVLAIAALAAGKIFGWIWLDPAMGIVGALIIIRWGAGLIKDTGRILLDRDVSIEYVDNIRSMLEKETDVIVSDIHVWKVSGGKMACIVALVTHTPMQPEYYKSKMESFPAVEHITIEVNTCDGCPPGA